MYKVRTFGASNVTLRGLVPLPTHICGIKMPHFYFVDVDAPALIGYGLMRVGRLVIDVHNRLVWSRRDDLPASEGPNPPTSVANSTIRSCVFL